MGYESAGIRFTEGPQGNRPAAQTPVQEAVQLLRLRVPKFSGAQSPVAPQLMAGGPPMMQPSAPMLQQLQPLLQALTGGTPAPMATNRPTFTGGEPTPTTPPNAALIQQLLRRIIESQQQQQLPAGQPLPPPQFQYQTPPTPEPTPPQVNAPVGQPPPTYGQSPQFQPGPGFSGYGGFGG